MWRLLDTGSESAVTEMDNSQQQVVNMAEDVNQALPFITEKVAWSISINLTGWVNNYYQFESWFRCH